MKFRIEDDGTSPILLFLEKPIHGGTDMLLMGKMPDGCKFVIMAFLENGTFTRYAGIPADSGFQLTMTNAEGVGQQLIEAPHAGIEGISNAMSARDVLTAMPVNPTATRIVFDDIVHEIPDLPIDYDEDV